MSVFVQFTQFSFSVSVISYSIIHLHESIFKTGEVMRKKICAAALAASLVLTGTAHAAETAKMSAKQIRSATLSTQSSGPVGSIGPEVVAWIILGIVFIAALTISHGGSSVLAGGGYPGEMLVASDERLKTDIKRVGTSEAGFGIYEFRYKGHAQRMRGAMAQDVARLRPQAVSRHETGFLAVDYNQIDVTPALIN